jgi:3-methyladenine DNA glycosylase AlkC
MSDDEQRLIEEARRSREETEELRKEASEAQDESAPWAKTSSGDTESVTDDD